MQALKIKNFSKSYDGAIAVENISLEVNAGELFGLIGPDGAGKTTLMRTICTLLTPDEGEIRVNDLNVRTDILAIRKILGYMPQRFSLYQDLSVEQNLHFFADIFNVPENERVERLKQLYHFSRLEPFKKRKAGALSGGMKQKLALSCALIHTPQVMVLDEPTFGVDPVSRQEFWEILSEIQKSGAAIFVSTAYMDEADLCDRVALMHQGRILASGTPEELKSKFPYPLYKITGKDVRSLRHFFQAEADIHDTQLFGDSIHISFEKQPGEQQWREWQQKSEGNLREWVPQSPSIEDVFMDQIEGGTR